MTTPPDAALLTTTSESLAPLLPILNGFAHRHKNQHSSSHWWSSFSLLRRAVRNIVEDLNIRPRKTKSGNVKRDSHPALARAKWMMRHVVPRAFVAFSQLAADNQHAPLGLLLLSVLARIHTLLSHLVPTNHDGESSISAVTKSMPLEPNRSTPLELTTAEAPAPDVDMGVAISRDELLSTQKKARSIPESGSNLKEPKPKERKSKSLHTNLHKSSPNDDTKDRPKKKKRKDSDAFSSLFGSL
ncbi:Ribonuclease MRP protein subunit rmp1 [Fusarium austroafricanum]|uniref:Ribonuclease MRP protein subunit rmp1 n=1 Tax=Fusarium austroafricanum TaxID=2364996 RepID=A0A8H4KB29_9HYPO|nr:Ribonuclease MRP protein subunit rmp1 [Fusarium austroafricanum]